VTFSAASFAIGTHAARAAAAIIAAALVLTVGYTLDTGRLVVITNQSVVTSTTRAQATVVATQFAVATGCAITQGVSTAISALAPFVVGVTLAVINAGDVSRAVIAGRAIWTNAVVFKHIACAIADTSHTQARFITRAIACDRIRGFDALNYCRTLTVGVTLFK
jgi:hypothetical protein